jgi:hypothetical protein
VNSFPVRVRLIVFPRSGATGEYEYLGVLKGFPGMGDTGFLTAHVTGAVHTLYPYSVFLSHYQQTPGQDDGPLRSQEVLMIAANGVFVSENACYSINGAQEILDYTTFILEMVSHLSSVRVGVL